MNIVLIILRDVIVDDEFKIIYLKPPCRDIRGNENRKLTFL